MNKHHSMHAMLGAHVPNTRLSNGFSKPKRKAASYAEVREAAKGFLRDRGVEQFGPADERPMPKQS